MASSLQKSDLISKVASVTGESKAATERVLAALQDEIISAVADGKAVRLTGFLSFIPTEAAPRSVLLPSTREKIVIPGKKVVRVKPLGRFRDEVEGS